MNEDKLVAVVCHLPQSFWLIKSPWQGNTHRHTVLGQVPQPNSWHRHCCSSPRASPACFDRNQHSSQMLLPHSLKEHSLRRVQTKTPMNITYIICNGHNLWYCVESLALHSPSQPYNSLHSANLDCTHKIFLCNFLLQIKTVHTP